MLLQQQRNGCFMLFLIFAIAAAICITPSTAAPLIDNGATTLLPVVKVDDVTTKPPLMVKSSTLSTAGTKDVVQADTTTIAAAIKTTDAKVAVKSTTSVAADKTSRGSATTDAAVKKDTGVPVTSAGTTVKPTPGAATVQCVKFHNRTIAQNVRKASIPEFNTSQINITQLLSYENVQCSNHCSTFICHNGTYFVYGGGCMEDFDEMCSGRVLPDQKPLQNETCSFLEGSYLLNKCKGNKCNDIANQTLVPCITSALMANYRFKVAEPLRFLVPLIAQNIPHTDDDLETTTRPLSKTTVKTTVKTNTTTAPPVPSPVSTDPQAPSPSTTGAPVNSATETTKKNDSKSTDAPADSSSTNSASSTSADNGDATTAKASIINIDFKVLSMLLMGFLIALY